MAFLLLPLEADFGFSQVERVLAFRPDRLAVSKSATGGQKWHLTATGGRFWQSAGCHWRSILPNETESWPLPRVATAATTAAAAAATAAAAAAAAAATTAAATAAAAAAHKEGSPW